MAGGIGGSGMAGQNMGLSNLMPKMGMSPDARAMLAQVLMQNQMRNQPDGPLGALAGMASMYAAGKTATGAADAKKAEAAEVKAAEEAENLRRVAAARGTLAQLGQTLYGGQGMEGYEGLITPDDPYAGLRTALTMRAGRERPQGSGRDPNAAGWTLEQGYDPEGNPVTFRVNPRTGQSEIVPGLRPINPDTGSPYLSADPITPPGAPAPEGPGMFERIGNWWSGSTPQAGTTGPASPATVPATPVPTGPRAGAVPPPPPGISPDLWAEMTPDERAAFQ